MVLLAGLYVGWNQLNGSHSSPSASSAAGSDLAASAFKEHRSGVRIDGEGVVDRVLSDDENGGRHQRFVLRLASGQTLLVAHNIDLAPRVSPLRRGDVVAFNGVYEWNEQGGVVHWTHRDPNGQHKAGWLKRDGEAFQ
jgi:hypothetical protein